MAFTIKARLQGVEQAVRDLDDLKKGVRNRVLRKALNKGARIIVQAARANVPVRYGLLKKSLGSIIRTYRSGRVVAVIGPRVGFKAQVGTRVKGGSKSKIGDAIMADPARYAHLVEMGHGGPHPAGPQPFLRPALDSNKTAVEQAIVTSIEEDIVALTVKLRRVS